MAQNLVTYHVWQDKVDGYWYAAQQVGDAPNPSSYAWFETREEAEAWCTE
jgi:hypothetical protein